MNHPWLTSVLWVSIGAMLHVALSPPAKTAKEDNIQDEGRFMRNLIGLLPYFRALQWFITIVNILTIHSATFRRITSFPKFPDGANIDAKFLAAFTLLSISFLLRFSSYRSLGDMFTFDVTIRPNHKLIMDGPYRFVRHPSYTGVFGILIGNTILHCVVTEHWVAKCAFLIWTLRQSAICIKLWMRTEYEDEGLRRRFGAEWESYKERVPCRFVPGII